jgi:hypothetical protein
MDADCLPCFTASRARQTPDAPLADELQVGILGAFPELLWPLEVPSKVAAPWGRVDLAVVASGYSDSGNALAEHLFRDDSLDLRFRWLARKQTFCEIPVSTLAYIQETGSLRIIVCRAG